MDNAISLNEYSTRVKLPVEILRGSRYWTHALARNTYWYYLKKINPRTTYKAIARRFPLNGKPRAHSTIISGINTIENILSSGNIESIEKYLVALNINIKQNQDVQDPNAN